MPENLIQAPEFVIAIALGAAITVFLATKIGMPISTTHSLVGALFGAGFLAVGMSFNFQKLGSTFFIPLILSPFMAAVFSMILYFIFNRVRLALGVNKETCICVDYQMIPVKHVNKNSVALMGAIDNRTKISVKDTADCFDVYQGHLFGISSQRILDVFHFFSAGIVSFARGLNDTPKIVGLLLILNSLNISLGLTAVAIAMAVGGLLNARKVGETMSEDITTMNHGQGFTANLITGLLVTTASIHGMPVSTTHVSVGSLFGIGAVTKSANMKVIKNILLSWVLTLPISAAISGGAYFLLRI